jgi:CubicO group peptidase (beta-lactamase class C family)
VGVAIGALAAAVATWFAVAAIVYSPEYVWRVLSWGESDVGDYVDGFPLRTLSAAPTPSPFAEAPGETAVRRAFEDALGVADLEQSMEDSHTQALLVIKDDALVYEGYFNDTRRDSMLTSFSVAKSFVSILVGIALAEGHIGDVEDPITVYLPELAARDERFAHVTIRDLLAMASGMEYEEFRWWLFNGDDPLTTYFTDQRELALSNTAVVAPAGEYFHYNKYHPQLLGLILERTTGMSVTAYTQARLWNPLGMQFDGAWALDSDQSGFEKMEAGLNARAVDYAKLGRLILHRGRWRDTQIVPSQWVRESTSLDPATHTVAYYRHGFGPEVYDDGQGYYAYMWYGRLRDRQPADIAAVGDRGQFIYISPANDVVIVRNGLEFGIPMHEWSEAFYEVAGRL